MNFRELPSGEGICVKLLGVQPANKEDPTCYFYSARPPYQEQPRSPFSKLLDQRVKELAAKLP